MDDGASNGRRGLRGFLLGTALVLGASIWAPSANALVTLPPLPPPGSCQRTGTTLEGTAAGEVLCGTEGNDVLNGNGGNDELHGFGGNDTLNGGDGNDALLGGTGDDRLVGGTGDDHLEGSTGNDVLRGESGADILAGQEGNDVLSGGDGNDTLSGGEGVDEFSGGEGNDLIEMRDGVQEPIPFCGGGSDTVDMDLKDNEVWLLTAIGTFGGSLLIASCETVNVGAVKEGPNVVIPARALRVGKRGRTAVRLQCPASLDIPCAGTLTLAVLEKSKTPRSRPATSYSLQPGQSGNVTARLSGRDWRTLRRRGRVRAWVLSVETGHFGNKTTLRTVVLQ